MLHQTNNNRVPIKKATGVDENISHLSIIINYFSLYIYLNVLQQQKLELNESTKWHAWLSMLDTSPRRAYNSEESKFIFVINILFSCTPQHISSETMVHHIHPVTIRSSEE